MNKGRAKGESQQQNERDCGQSPVGDKGALVLLEAGLGAASTFASFHFGRLALTLLAASWGAARACVSFHFGPRALALYGGSLGAVPAGVEKSHV